MEKSLTNERKAQLCVTLPNLVATRKLAHALAPLATAGDLIGLRGEVGTGKTTFARFFIRALASAQEEVPSPTFSLVQTYPTASTTLWHFDLYRLTQPEAIFELGWEEAIQGIVLLEWPERLGDLLPDEYLEIHLTHESTRQASVYGPSSWARRLQAVRR